MVSFMVFAAIAFMSPLESFSKLFDNKASLLKSGDVLLQGLFPITYKDGQDRCSRIYKDGLMWSMAMIYAVDSIDNSTFLGKTTLGYKIDNTCYNIPTAMSNAIEIVAKYRPNSVCYPRHNYCESADTSKASYGKIAAVIGPALSWIAIPVASLLGLYDIPQISYAATSRILSDKTRYRSFLRTVPSDEYQAKAMADFVRRFDWNYVFLIASDDDYGKMGAATFKKTARSLNVCIAHDEYIPFGSDMAKEYIHNTLVTLKNFERAKVVIVFSYADQGELLLKKAQELNITDRTWIASDAWSSTVTTFNVSKPMLEGVFTFSIRSKKVNEFIHYINNLKIQDVQNISWFKTYMEEILDCTSSNHSNGKRPCRPTNTLPSDHVINTEAIANVIDAVNVTAHALRNMFSCVPGSGCRDPYHPITPHELLQYVKNISFRGADHANVEFNVNGDRTSSGYTIRNVQIQGNAVGFVDVGYYFWSMKSQEPNFKIKPSLIKWNRGSKPLSSCFRVCQPGERVVGQSECCWNCQKCEKGSYSSITGALSCTKCNDTHYTNDGQTACLLRAMVYLTLPSPGALSILTISIIGIVINTIIVGIFTWYRNTSVVSGSTIFHTVLFFVILYLSFIFCLLFIVNKPSNKICSGIESLHEILMMMYASFLLSKTRAVNKKVRSVVPQLRDMRQDWSQIALVGLLVVLQLILITVRQSINPSVIHFLNQENGTRLLECKQLFPISRIIAIAIPCSVLIIATFISFRERNNPENFNEAKFISFTTILLCIILIAFIPTYRYVIGTSRILVLTFTVFITAFSGMGCVFIPKLYILLLHPERNVLSSPNTQDTPSSCQTPETQVNSARTSVTDDLSPDFNDNPKSSRYLNMFNEKKGLRVTSFLNHGLVPGDESLRDAANEPTNHVLGKQASNGRKRSRTSPCAQVTFELPTVAETSEDGGTWSPVQERDVNEMYKDDAHALAKATPRAFTVI